jgi:hypothetical protein
LSITQHEFLKRLAKASLIYPPALYGPKAVLRLGTPGTMCPLRAVFGRHYITDDDISVRSQDVIMGAADNNIGNDPTRIRMRALLLKACNLKEASEDRPPSPLPKEPVQ